MHTIEACLLVILEIGGAAGCRKPDSVANKSPTCAFWVSINKINY